MAEGAPILGFFWDLASVEEERRLAASEQLLDALAGAQAARADACPDMTYTLKRLVRGLGSSRDAARQGFSTVLIEVLLRFSSVVRVEEVLDLMESTMQLQGSMDGTEERDMLLGRLFTCASVLRSGLLPQMSADRRKLVATRVSKELIFCFGKKSFLQELAVVLLGQLIEQLPAPEVQQIVWPHVGPLVASPLSEWSAHALFLALRLCRMLPRATMGALLPHIALRNGTLIHTANLPHLVQPFKASTVAHPRVHCVWSEAFAHICNVGAAAPSATGALDAASSESTTTKKGKKKIKKGGDASAPATEQEVTPTVAIDEGLLRGFWQLIVDDGLVSSTLERKYLSFLLLQQACYYDAS